VPPLAARPRYLICRRIIAQRHSFGLDSEFTRAGCFLIFQLVCRTSVPKKRETRRRPLSKWCVAFSIGYRNFLRLKQEGATGRDLTEWGLCDWPSRFIWKLCNNSTAFHCSWPCCPVANRSNSCNTGSASGIKLSNSPINRSGPEILKPKLEHKK
jgi:hypothetical protein